MTSSGTSNSIMLCTTSLLIPLDWKMRSSSCNIVKSWPTETCLSNKNASKISKKNTTVEPDSILWGAQLRFILNWAFSVIVVSGKLSPDGIIEKSILLGNPSIAFDIFRRSFWFKTRWTSLFCGEKSSIVKTFSCTCNPFTFAEKLSTIKSPNVFGIIISWCIVEVTRIFSSDQSNGME